MGYLIHQTKRKLLYAAMAAGFIGLVKDQGDAREKLNELIPITKEISFLEKFETSHIHKSQDSITISGTLLNKSIQIIKYNKHKGFELKAIGSGLSSKTLFPTLKKIPEISFNSLAYHNSMIEIHTKIHGKSITLSIDHEKRDVVIIGANHLKLSDFYSEFKKSRILDNIDFKKLEYRYGKTIEIEGEVGHKDIKISEDLHKLHFVLTGQDVHLGDLIPSLNDNVYLKEFDLDKVTIDKHKINIEGKINKKPLRASFNNGPGELEFSLKAEPKSDITIGDLIPKLAHNKAFERLRLSSIDFKRKEISISGLLGEKEVQLALGKDKRKVDLSLTGKLIIGDIIPKLDNSQVLNEFEFDSLGYSSGEVKVNGSINHKPTTIDLSKADKNLDFALTGEDITIGDIVPKFKKLTFFKKFKFETITYKDKELNITGKVGAKDTSIKFSKADGSLDFDLTGKDILVSDIVPQLKKLKYLDNFKFEKLSHTTGDFVIKGTVHSKETTFEFTNPTEGVDFTLSGKGIVIGDIVSPLNKSKFFQKFGFDRLTFVSSNKSLAIDGKINSKGVTLNFDKPEKGFDFELTDTETDKGKTLDIGDVISPLKGNKIFDNFGFKSLKFDSTNKSFSVAGAINSKGVTLSFDKPEKGFDFELTETPVKNGKALVIGDIIPPLQGNKFFAKFGFESLKFDGANKSIDIAGTINSKQVSLHFDKPANGFDFELKKKERGTSLFVKDIVSQLQSIKLFDNFGFESLKFDEANKSLAVAATINSKEVTLNFDKPENGFDFELKETKTETIKPIVIGDIIPPLKKVKFFNNFGFESLHFESDQKTLSVVGAINLKTVTLDLDSPSNGFNFKLTADDIVVGDIVPPLKKVSTFNNFDFDSLDYKNDKKSSVITVNGKIDSKDASLNFDNLDDGFAFNLTGDKLSIGDFVSEFSKIQIMNNAKFEKLSFTENKTTEDVSFTIDGTINNKPISIDLEHIKTAISVELDAKDAGVTIVDFAPALNVVTPLQKAAVTYVRLKEDATSKSSKDISFEIDGTIGEDHTDLKLVVDDKAGEVTATLTGDHVTIGDIVDSAAALPVINDIGFDELVISKKFIEVDIDIDGHQFRLIENFEKKFVSLYVEQIDASMFIPQIPQDSPINDVGLNDAFFVFPINEIGITPSDLPKDIGSKLNLAGNSKMALKSGINIAADVKNVFDSILSKINIHAKSLPLKGVAPKKLFAHLKPKPGSKPKTKSDKSKNSGTPGKGTGEKIVNKSKAGLKKAKDTADKASNKVRDFLAGLNLKLVLPTPDEMPLLSPTFSFDKSAETFIEICGGKSSGAVWDKVPKELQQHAPSGDVHITLQSGVEFALDGIKEDLDLLINLGLGKDNSKKAQDSLTLIAVSQGEWDEAFGIKDLTVKGAGFEISLKSKEVDLSLFSTATFKGEELDVEGFFEAGAKGVAFKYLEVDDPTMKLSSLVSIPDNAFDCQLVKLLIAPNGLEVDANVKLGGVTLDTKVFVFEIDGDPIVAIALGGKASGGFDLGKLAKMLKLDNKNITAKMDMMATGDAALILCEKAKTIKPADLTDGIAKDMFSKVLGNYTGFIELKNLTFIADFSMSECGSIGDAFTGNGLNLGFSDDMMIIGEVGGLFDSTPLSLTLKFINSEGLNLSGLKLPGLLKPSNTESIGAEQGLFLKLVGETFEFGLMLEFDVTLTKDLSAAITGTLGLQLAEEDIGISLSGRVDDNLTIKGVSLNDVIITGEIEEGTPVQFKIGVGGDVTIMGYDAGVAADVSVDFAGEIPVPSGFGMKTTLSNLDKAAFEGLGAIAVIGVMAAYPEAIPLTLVGYAVSIPVYAGGEAIYNKEQHNGKTLTAEEIVFAPIRDLAAINAWFIGGKDIYISVATPGASDANLEIPDGIHLNGQVAFFGGRLCLPKISPNIKWIYKIMEKL